MRAEMPWTAECRREGKPLFPRTFAFADPLCSRFAVATMLPHERKAALLPTLLPNARALLSRPGRRLPVASTGLHARLAYVAHRFDSSPASLISALPSCAHRCARSGCSGLHI